MYIHACILYPTPQTLKLQSPGPKPQRPQSTQEPPLSCTRGFHSTEPNLCDDFDCFEFWRDATLKGFEQGQAMLYGLVQEGMLRPQKPDPPPKVATVVTG